MFKKCLIAVLCMGGILGGCRFGDFGTGGKGALDLNPPDNTVKINFIHHSTGSHWVQDGYGELGEALNANNYFLSECDYAWSAEPGDGLGNRTETENWPEWFQATKMPYVYNNSAHFDYENRLSDPGGENEIIMFKSCYPNSEVGNSINDEKAIYNSLLTYFASRTDKLFILVIPPPEITISSASLTRELSEWLVNRESGWLADYRNGNVFAFNYYNILTDPENHHTVDSNGIEVNLVSREPDDPAHPHELYYPRAATDNHPDAVGQRKATREFIPLLNGWYHKWVASR